MLLTRSGEVENKLRADVNSAAGRWQYSYGVVGQLVHYDNRYFNRMRRPVRDAQRHACVQPGVDGALRDRPGFCALRGLWAGSPARFCAGDRLTVSAGLRADGNTPSPTTAPTWPAPSRRAPRLRYALLPTAQPERLGGPLLQDSAQHHPGLPRRGRQPVNQGSSYIRADHYVAGLEWLPAPATRFTLEGFYKKYANYPVSVRDGISLANLGGDFNGPRQRGRAQYRPGPGLRRGVFLPAETHRESCLPWCRSRPSAPSSRAAAGPTCPRPGTRAFWLRRCWAGASGGAGSWASSTAWPAARPTRPSTWPPRRPATSPPAGRYSTTAASTPSA